MSANEEPKTSVEVESESKMLPSPSSIKMSANEEPKTSVEVESESKTHSTRMDKEVDRELSFIPKLKSADKDSTLKMSSNPSAKSSVTMSHPSNDSPPPSKQKILIGSDRSSKPISTTDHTNESTSAALRMRKTESSFIGSTDARLSASFRKQLEQLDNEFAASNEKTVESTDDQTNGVSNLMKIVALLFLLLLVIVIFLQFFK